MIYEEAGFLRPRRSQERWRGGTCQHLQIESFPGAASALRAVTMQNINNYTLGTKADNIPVFSKGFISYSGWLQKPS